MANTIMASQHGLVEIMRGHSPSTEDQSMNRPIRTFSTYNEPAPIARMRVVTPLLIVLVALAAWAAWIYLPH